MTRIPTSALERVPALDALRRLEALDALKPTPGHLRTILESFGRIDRPISNPALLAARAGINEPELLRAQREQNARLAAAGGFPSSHSALITEHATRGFDATFLASSRYARTESIVAGLHGSRLFEEAGRITATWSTARMPLMLRMFQHEQDALATRLAVGATMVNGLRGHWEHPEFGRAFSAASAYSNMLAHEARVGRDALSAVRELSATGLPGLIDMVSVRGFLDAAGLVPPLSRGVLFPDLFREPRVREIPKKERQARWNAMKREEAAPQHVTKAYGLIHVTERMLRRVLEKMMALVYGADWPYERLLKCHCKSLLKKWTIKGGRVLDHADWSDYSRIMVHDEHYDDIFAAGFEDPEVMLEVLDKARSLRAAIGHVNDFTPQNLLDLRLTFTTLENGLVDAMSAFEFRMFDDP